MQNRDLRPELQVSVGPRTPLWNCACKTACLPLELLVSMCLRLHLWICANKTAFLAPKLLLSMGPSPHLWWVPHITCRFEHAIQRD